MHLTLFIDFHNVIFPEEYRSLRYCWTVSGGAIDDRFSVMYSELFGSFRHISGYGSNSNSSMYKGFSGIGYLGGSGGTGQMASYFDTHETLGSLVLCIKTIMKDPGITKIGEKVL